MRLTRRTAKVELGGREFTVTELSCAEAEAIEDLWQPADGSRVRPLRVTAESVVVALKAAHPGITASELMRDCTARELLAAMKLVNQISAIEGDATGEAGSP